MRIVYQREMARFFHRMRGPLYLAGFLLVVGVLFVFQNLVGQNGQFELALSSAMPAFAVLLPLLTVDLWTQEERTGQVWILFSSPLQPEKIILGKYLAAMTVYGIGFIISGIFPLILAWYGQIDGRRILAAYGGLFLVGAVGIAMGLFLSSALRGRAVTAVATVVWLWVFLNWREGTLPRDLLSSLLVFFALGALLGLGTYWGTGEKVVSLEVFTAFALIVGVIFFIRPDWFVGLGERVVSAVLPLAAFHRFALGLVRLRDIFLLVAWVAVALFLAVLALWRRRWGEGAFLDRKKKPARRWCAFGGVLLAALTGIMLIINPLGVGWDLTQNGVYTLSAQTKQVLDELNEPVQIYAVYPAGEENAVLLALLEQYDDASSEVSVAVVTPEEAAQVSTDADALQAGAVLVVTEDAVTVIPSQDAAGTFTDVTGVSYLTDLRLEGALTGTLRTQALGEVRQAYALMGHGEMALEEGTLRRLSYFGLQVDILSLAEEEIPANTALVLCNAPTEDLTEVERQRLEAYLSEGGAMLLTLGPGDTAMPQRDALLASFGLSATGRLVIEGMDGYAYNANPYYLLPQVTEQMAGEANLPVLMPFATALTVAEGADVQVLLESSSASYSKAFSDLEEPAQSEDDPVGPFVLGALAENEAGGSLAVLGSETVLEEMVDEACGGGNDAFFDHLTAALLQQEDPLLPKALGETAEIEMNTAQRGVWAVLCGAALPAVVLLGGAMVQIRRRNGTHE